VAVPCSRQRCRAFQSGAEISLDLVHFYCTIRVSLWIKAYFRSPFLRVIVLELVRQLPQFRAAAAHLRTPCKALTASGLWGASSSLFIAALYQELKRPLVAVAAGPELVDNLEEDIRTFHDANVLSYPYWEVVPLDEDALNVDTLYARLSVIARLKEAGAPPLIATSVQALMQPEVSAKLLEQTVALARGKEIAPAGLLRTLVEAGFSRVDMVEVPGEVAARGGIVDVFPLLAEFPSRFEFFGDEIESIRQFDPVTQRSVKDVGALTFRAIAPKDALACITTAERGLAGFLPDDAVVVFIDRAAIEERARIYEANRSEDDANVFSFGALHKMLAPFAALSVSPFADSDKGECVFNVKSVERFSADFERAADVLRTLAAGDAAVRIYCNNKAERERLSTILADAGLATSSKLAVSLGAVSAGFDFTDIGHVVLTENELFRRYTVRRKVKRPRRAASPIDDFTDLELGDHVVHVNYGIGLNLGIQTLERHGKREDFLGILFAGDVKLYVPLTHIALVGKYIGGSETEPELSRIGSAEWQKRKKRVEAAADNLASDLLELAAARARFQGFIYPPDDEWQRNFEHAFLYDETTDQIEAIRSIKEDMESPAPMDRLLCGDVGFGKTELAIRAAFKAVTAGRQVAVLVPTTILAEQHYKTFTERMADYPVSIAALSRFKTKTEQAAILERLAAGALDIVIGTHRLLQKDVRFKNLGLAIVDEEQRFGVRHKEHFKTLRKMLDVLTLTATPIPRTLHMALMGVRDISNLATPPDDRLAIQTKVTKFNKDLVRRAIVRELNRGGQVYFVHNRVLSIGGIAAKLARLVPEARFAVAHGQMYETGLEDIMRRFVGREIDVLVSTCIIESGLDIPNVNTIIINRADMFGLADLHQLRGRVGRYKHKAYAYMLIPGDSGVGEQAKKRLKAIEEFDELGAGFKLAMRDLEIRGAGNVLGGQQSGYIAAVGYDLYCRILEKTVRKIKGELIDDRIEVTVNLGAAAFIPDGYVSSHRQKISYYRKIAAAGSNEDVEYLRAEMTDRSGPPPPETERLLDEARLIVLARHCGITHVGREGDDLIFVFAATGMKDVEAAFAPFRKNIRMIDPHTLRLGYRGLLAEGEKPFDFTKKVLQIVAEKLQ